jgi:hypothetical protein
MHNQFSEDERDYYITMDEISQVWKSVDQEIIELDPNDANSTWTWVHELEAKGHNVFYKSKQDLPPEGSDLASQLFILCIQTKFQLAYFWDLGNSFLGIDATHNVTQYKGILLFTIMAWDRWGHGVYF